MRRIVAHQVINHLYLFFALLMQCTSASPVYQMCTFQNVLLYGGDLWYVVQDGVDPNSTDLPDPTIFEVGNSPSNSVSLPTLVTVLTLSNARSFIRNRNKDQPLLRVATFEKSILQRTRTFENWFWALNGAGNIYHRLCKYFDLCSAQDIKTAAIIQPAGRSSYGLGMVGYLGLPPHHGRAVKELMSCFGPLLWANHPKGQGQEEGRPPFQLVILRNMLVGIGEDVVQPKAARDHRSRVRYRRADDEMALKRVQFLRSCAGLPPQARVANNETRPSVLLVNRPYGDGRSILGLDDVYDRLKRSLPSDVDVRLYLPRGHAGIYDQASAFDQSSVVVAPHGAATANFNFLPYDAVALGVHALIGRFRHDKAVGASLPSPPYNITVLPVDCSESTEARSNAAGEKLAEFPELKAVQRLGLLLDKRMTDKLARNIASLLDMTLLDWMDYRSYAPDPAELEHMVLEAINLWRSKVQARASQLDE